ncbi:MAG: Endoribonuclease MazF4 [Mycoplasmataceae bacterium]|nr:MAG: Endoribonuclease MazF4 [Mycoplasmataceae bacterium]
MVKINYAYPQRGEIWLVKTDKIKEFSKDYRPVLIISNNWQNEQADEVTIVSFTTQRIEQTFPFEVLVSSSPENGLDQASKINTSLIFSLNKQLRLIKKLGKITNNQMLEVEKALHFSFNMNCVDFY